MSNSQQIKGIIYGLLAASIWGGMYVVSDVVLKSIPPFTLLTIRLIIGILVLGAMIFSRKRTLETPNKALILQILGIGFFGFGISVGAQFVGTDKSTAINGSLVTSASPAFILIFAVIILKERLTFRHIAAVILATIGVLVIVDPSKANLSSDMFSGNVALAVAAITWGLYSILVRQVSAKTDTLVVTFIAFIGGLVLTIPASILELQSRPIGSINSGTILSILYLGVVSTAGAMWLWNRAFALVNASTASITFFAQPVVGTILSIMLLGQTLQPPLMIGGILILAGVALTIIEPKRKNPASTGSSVSHSSSATST